ncbi:MAG: phosphate acetyltransferase [Ignavibacteria bacterium GWF2_33_9]|nr:MAG: phosphate acetyltransferase [Ignavibacteria bacterium GWF2_33_9]
MSSTFVNEMLLKAKVLGKSVVYPDAADTRSIEAAAFLAKEGIARPILTGNPNAIQKVAEENNLSLEGIQIIDTENNEWLGEFAELLYEKRKEKGMTLEQAVETVKNPLYFAGLMLDTGKTDVVVGGNVSSTGDILRASIHTVGVAPGISIVSSYFLMVFPDKIYCFADCAVNPNPNAEQLADIAISSARNFQSVTGIEPAIGMLSFSTNGSADHDDVDKVRTATQFVREKAPELAVDGEMQFDAAIIPAIGQRKFPGSKVAGNVNVMVFPDLDAGNIGYKITQRLGGAEAVGPFVQGLKKPYCDLSRGASVEDMISVAAINILMA